MSSSEGRIVWNEVDVEGQKYVLRYIQVLRDKTTLDNTAPVAYPVHVVLMKCSAKYHRLLLVNGHSVVCFLSANIGNDLKYICSIY